MFELDVNKGYKGFTDIGGVNFEEFKDALRVRPLAMGFHVAQSFFQYKGGIYDNPSCPTSMNHAMQAVGFGTEDGKEFAIIKNSWGSGWGMDGFVKVKMGADDREGGVCQMYEAPSYPHLK